MQTQDRVIFIWIDPLLCQNWSSSSIILEFGDEFFGMLVGKLTMPIVKSQVLLQVICLLPHQQPHSQSCNKMILQGVLYSYNNSIAFYGNQVYPPIMGNLGIPQSWTT